MRYFVPALLASLLRPPFGKPYLMTYELLSEPSSFQSSDSDEYATMDQAEDSDEAILIRKTPNYHVSSSSSIAS